jgi:hypothetical protein
MKGAGCGFASLTLASSAALALWEEDICIENGVYVVE